MKAMNRIRQINKQLNKVKPNNTTYDLITKIDRWKYGYITHISQNNGKDTITLKEWNDYQNHILKLAKERNEDEQKVQQEIKELESIIRKGEGFMEIIFVSFKTPDSLTLEL